MSARKPTLGITLQMDLAVRKAIAETEARVCKVLRQRQPLTYFDYHWASQPLSLLLAEKQLALQAAKPKKPHRTETARQISFPGISAAWQAVTREDQSAGADDPKHLEKRQRHQFPSSDCAAPSGQQPKVAQAPHHKSSRKRKAQPSEKKLNRVASLHKGRRS